MNQENLKLILEFFKFFGPGVLLPIYILWLTGRQNKKIKELEQQNDILKIVKAKEIEGNFIIEDAKKQHEKVVHSSLIKILFEVQKLHISLSGNCVDYKCLNEATNNFKESFSKYQSIISDNQIYLSSSVTNSLYKFYKNLGELMIEINEIENKKEYDLAIVPVYDYSEILANIIIEIQENFIKKRQDLISEFNKIELTDFTGCCGKQPPKHLRDKYYLLKENLENLGEPLEPFQQN